MYWQTAEPRAVASGCYAQLGQDQIACEGTEYHPLATARGSALSARNFRQDSCRFSQTYQPKQWPRHKRRGEGHDYHHYENPPRQNSQIIANIQDY